MVPQWGSDAMPDLNGGWDSERAPLLRRAFEEYATGRFTKEQLLKQTRV
jgi:hypothetical protein